MNRSDESIKEFFAKMRKDDDTVEIPAFEEFNRKKQRSGKIHYLPVGIAASLLLLAGVYFGMYKKKRTQEKADLVIILSDDGENSTTPFISNGTSITSWESPTGSLINDFND
ncbi:hypothetical protein FNH22_06055 [Fulvivirga sp. M361]|uniref:hypothetical protein n=1 Tax=Fulvivirga sp. M361 TaxID=2594266 RepID=UPI00117B3950|nr:hypothetical protein [Fulvivirga sp. M361]TRX60610.1 hypothetical protein FNH22_06055 [Fulvivirga sp. M361]